MTDKAVIKAYEGLTANQQLNLFRNLHYNDGNSTVNGIIANAINDILPQLHRQQAEIEILQHKYELAVAEREANVKGFTETLEKQRVEIERLKNINKKLDGFVLEARAEGIKEFAERVKVMSEYGTINVSSWQVDNLVKEMTEERTE